MDDDITVRLLAAGEMESILPLVKTLNPDVDEAVLAARLPEMMEQGYLCAGAFAAGRLVGICGLWVATRFYCGRYIEPDNVVVEPVFRSRGVGQALLAWVYDYGRSRGCAVCELNSYAGSARANKFYFAEGFGILGFHFQKRLDGE